MLDGVIASMFGAEGTADHDSSYDDLEPCVMLQQYRTAQFEWHVSGDAHSVVTSSHKISYQVSMKAQRELNERGRRPD
jgi:hypothetical protein